MDKNYQKGIPYNSSDEKTTLKTFRPIQFYFIVIYPNGCLHN